jgi:Uma2 family endonuclease
MHTAAFPVTEPEREIIYPESDGQPMADNTRQFRWIATIKGNLDAIYHDRPDVFVAGDLLWYPVEGKPRIRRAPDAMVVFGRPRGDRGSYKQWEEDHIAPQVVFEVQSPGNTAEELRDKFQFYDTYQVEEYYLYDPDDHALSGWLRQGHRLQAIPTVHHWSSPRLGIRFVLTPDELLLYRPDGQRFLSFEELDWEYQQERVARERAEQRAQQAEQQVAQERVARTQAEHQLEELLARLRSRGIDLDASEPEP